MVSFCCDECQNVLKKPRAANHFNACTTSSLSCIDCGSTFTRQTIGKHTSCLTESQKYERRSELNAARVAGNHDKNTYCEACQLELRGAVAALQHYESKKHRAVVRKTKAAGKVKARAKKETTKSEPDVGSTTREVKKQGDRQGRLDKEMKKAMKSILKQSGGSLKKKKLAKALRKQFVYLKEQEITTAMDNRIELSMSFSLQGKSVLLLD